MENKKMSGTTAIFLILTALLIDGLQGFLNLIIIGVVLNWIIDIFAALLFYVWLKSLGMPMIGGRGVMGTIFQTAGISIEIFPILNSFPGWTTFAVAKVASEFMP